MQEVLLSLARVSLVQVQGILMFAVTEFAPMGCFSSLIAAFLVMLQPQQDQQHLPEDMDRAMMGGARTLPQQKASE